MDDLINDTTIDNPYLEEGCISHLYESIRALHGSIWVENIWVPLQYVGNEAHMLSFLKTKQRGASTKKMEITNACRICVHVTIIAELADIDGR